MNEKIKSNIFLWITPIVWGSAFVTQRLGGEHLGAFTYNGMRFLLGCITLIPIILVFENKSVDPKNKKITLIGGVCGGLALFFASALQQSAIVMTQNAGKAGFLTAMYMVIVPVLGIFIGKRNGIFTWIGVAVAVVGMYLLSFEGNTPFGLGDLLLICCAFLFAVQILIIDKVSEYISPLRFSFVQLATTGILASVCACFFESFTYSDFQNALLPLLYSGIMSCGIGYTFQILGQKNTNETYASIVMSTESVFAVIAGAVFLGEQMNLNGYIGCVLIFLGIVLTQLKGKNHDKKVS